MAVKIIEVLRGEVKNSNSRTVLVSFLDQEGNPIQEATRRLTVITPNGVDDLIVKTNMERIFKAIMLKPAGLDKVGTELDMVLSKEATPGTITRGVTVRRANLPDEQNSEKDRTLRQRKNYGYVVDSGDEFVQVREVSPQGKEKGDNFVEQEDWKTAKFGPQEWVEITHKQTVRPNSSSISETYKGLGEKQPEPITRAAKRKFENFKKEMTPEVLARIKAAFGSVQDTSH